MRGWCIIEKDGKGNKKRDATKYACGEPSWFSGPLKMEGPPVGFVPLTHQSHLKMLACLVGDAHNILPSLFLVSMRHLCARPRLVYIFIYPADRISLFLFSLLSLSRLRSTCIMKFMNASINGVPRMATPRDENAIVPRCFNYRYTSCQI